MEPNTNSKASTSVLEFFKVFIPTSSSLHLCLPPAFVNHFDGALPSKAILKDHIGKSWHVTVEKVENHVYFKNGWQAFVDDHFLKYGDFLIFQYDGNQMFDVKMFGKNGLKKEQVVGVGDSVPNVKVKDEPQVEEEDGKPVVSRKRKHLGVRSNGKPVPKSKSISTTNVGKRNPPRTTKHVASEGRPCFERTMRHWTNRSIFISSVVLKKNEISMKAEIVLRDEEGRLWPGTVYSTTRNRLYIGGSCWPKFCRYHKLRVDDKCVFEFVLGERNVCAQINVKVTRHGIQGQKQII